MTSSPSLIQMKHLSARVFFLFAITEKCEIASRKRVYLDLPCASDTNGYNDSERAIEQVRSTALPLNFATIGCAVKASSATSRRRHHHNRRWQWSMTKQNEVLIDARFIYRRKTETVNKIRDIGQQFVVTDRRRVASQLQTRSACKYASSRVDREGR